MQLSANPETSHFTEAERAAILEQLERMLAHPQFRHSRRFPALLRFVVHTTLEGRGDSLKERTLGVEIFRKRLQYDTADDPIVRVTAAELRKRIALYYREPGHESELRLTLPLGCYVPRFDSVPATEQPYEPAPVVAPLSTSGLSAPAGLPAMPLRAATPVSPLPKARWFMRFGRRGLVAAVALVLLMAVGFFGWRSTKRTALQAFWRPVLSTTDPVLFCVADQTEYTNIQLRDAAQPTHQSVLRDNLTAVVIDDLSPIVDVGGLLRQNGKTYTVRGEGSTTMNDLRGGPTIFIGAFDNEWTLRMLHSQRYHFANSADMGRFSIVDTASRQPTAWVVDRQQQLATNIYVDFAIVSRFVDRDTGRPSVVIAGIGRGGTIAAGEFITTPSMIDQLAPQLKSAHSNIEVVLSTQVVGGQPGSPHVEAVYSW